MENKAYNTKQRQAILNCLADNGEMHLTADEIVDLLYQNGAKVGKSTVYRFLDKCEKDGVVRKYIAEDGKSACFQYIPEDGDCAVHHHLKCIHCNKLIHLECDFMDKLSVHIYNEHKFQIDDTRVILYGTCEECAKNLGGNANV